MATIGLWLLLASVLTLQAWNVHAAAIGQKSAVDDGLAEEVSKHEIQKRAAGAGLILMPPITMRSNQPDPPMEDRGFVYLDKFWVNRMYDDSKPKQDYTRPPYYKPPVPRDQDNQPENRAGGFILLPPVTMRSMHG